MSKANVYLGIDLGTSAVKCVLASRDEVIAKSSQKYEFAGIDGWSHAIKAAIADLEVEKFGTLCAIGLSSQVGTYIVDGKDVVHWWEPHGKGELEHLKSRYSKAQFLNAISMSHPDLVSYPLPRYLYIKKTFKGARKVVMPKDYIVEALTGECVSDPFSYRGLYNFEKGELARGLLAELDIDFELPRIIAPTECAGTVTADAAQAFGLPQGVPVYAGLNDFFAGLVGMGITKEGDCFELSGTSEHVGYISANLASGACISGDYITGYATYGGTKSSGKACELALNILNGSTVDGIQKVRINAPITLPYLSGERAPIYDDDARGVTFGISEATTQEDLAYSAFEGVVFSLYDVAKSIGMTAPKRIVAGGGSTKSPLMTYLKAELFDCEIAVVKESATSALGAAMTAMVGVGEYADFDEASAIVKLECTLKPSGRERDVLLQRFEIYRSLYQRLKGEFKSFVHIEEN